ncbi:12571_t:CDS:2, partial [Racocetra persica]
QINLTNKEWDAISLLIKVLRLFAKVTELLGGNKYATISFMYSAITVIKKGLFTNNNNSNIDFNFSFDIFDNDVVYEDKEELEENYVSSKQQQMCLVTKQY